MTKGLTRTVIAGAIALAMSVVPVSAAMAAPSPHHNFGESANLQPDFSSSGESDQSAGLPRPITLPDIPPQASCSVDLVATILPELHAAKVVKVYQVGQGLLTAYGVFADVSNNRTWVLTIWHVVPYTSCIDLLMPVNQSQLPEVLHAIQLAEDLPPVHFPSGNPLNGPGAPGANNPTTPTQSSPNPSTNLTTPDDLSGNTGLTCANIPGGCSHSGDTFSSGGTGVWRNGVSYGIPEGGYCENPAGTPGVIRNNACDT